MAKWRDASNEAQEDGPSVVLLKHESGAMAYIGPKSSKIFVDDARYGNIPTEHLDHVLAEHDCSDDQWTAKQVFKLQNRKL